MTLTDDLLREAMWTGHRFWTALAANDDDDLRSILTADALAVLARGALVPGPIDIAPKTPEDMFLPPGPAIASRIRSHLGTEFENDGLPGLADKAELLEGGELRLIYPVVGIARPMHEGVPILVWRIELVQDEGQWLVDPLRRHDRPTIETIDLGPLFGGRQLDTG